MVQQQFIHGDVCTLDVRGGDASNSGERARFLLPFEPIEALTIPRIPKVVSPAAWRRAVKATLATATSSPDSLRAAARAHFALMPYQLEPALAVVSGRACRLLIADEVGLGKTVQAGLIVAEVLDRHPGGRVLVVCPAVLRAQWRDELRERFHLAAALLDSSGIARLSAVYDASANPWSTSPLVITSIDFIKRPEIMRAVEGLVWDVLVFDEAHNLASRSDRATAAAALARRARTVVMLSATPHAGDEAAFARLCSIGDVHGRFPLVLFRRTRRDAGMPAQRRRTWLHVRPALAETRMHAALIEYARRVWKESADGNGGRLAMTVLLRRAASSAQSLARSLERRLESLAIGSVEGIDQLLLPFADGEADEEPAGLLTAPGLRDAAEERQALENLLALSRLAAVHESKVDAVLRWLARVREPILVFTEYRDTLTGLRHALTARGISSDRIAELHGGLPRSEREEAERRFVAGDADILLATDAASEGLNLHHRCRCVVNLEIPWNPVRLEQRIGRVDRIGQRQRVHAIHLIASGTFELTVVRRLVDRANRAAGALREATPSHEATATAILTGAAAAEPTRDTSVAPELRHLDLAARAGDEAREIAIARRLLETRSPSAMRPVATALNRHAQRLMCAFAVVMTDADGVPIWTTVVGLELPAPWYACRTPRDLRTSLATAAPSLDAAMEGAAIRLRTTAQNVMRAVMTIGVEREHAIAGAVRLRHARVAADLLQPGLFDRRAERRAVSQSLVLEEALGRCHQRLESLERLITLNSDPPNLRFAVFLD